MSTPKIVYKYRSWNNVDHINFLAFGEIYLASPAEINDPFDCRIPNDLSLLCTDKKRGRFVDETLTRHYSDEELKGEKLITQRNIQIRDLRDNSDQYQGKLETLLIKSGNEHSGIFSTSLIWDSIQMWSYYSENHSGFCVGLDGERIFDSLPNQKSAPINYSKKYPRIDPLGDKIRNSFMSTHTKDKNWKHEKEYRFFSNLNIPGKENNSRIIKLTKDCFKEIIIGLQFPEKDIEKMKVYAKRLEVPIYTITKSKMRFKLDRKEI